MSGGFWVNWCWKKSGNDGRRTSGNSFKRGLWHWMHGDKTACGREPQLYANRQEAEPPVGRTCFMCRQAFEKGQVQP